MDLKRFDGKAGKLGRRTTTFGREMIEYDFFIPKPLPELNGFCNDISIMEKSNLDNQ